MSEIEYLVTSISELTKKRRLVYINYEPAFALYNTEIRRLGIEIDKPITADVYDSIVNDLLTKRTTIRAMALLKDRDYTESMLRDKLKDAYYPETCIDVAVDYVSRFGYINDRRYVENYVNFKSETKTRRQIEQELHRKGIDEALIDEVCDEFYSEEGCSKELDMAVNQLEKKLRNKDVSDYNEIQKAKGFLYRKGFSIELINKALDIVLKEC